MKPRWFCTAVAVHRRVAREKMLVFGTGQDKSADGNLSGTMEAVLFNVRRPADPGAQEMKTQLRSTLYINEEASREMTCGPCAGRIPAA